MNIPNLVNFWRIYDKASFIKSRNVILGSGFQNALNRRTPDGKVADTVFKDDKTESNQCIIHMHCVSRLDQINTVVKASLSVATKGAVTVPSIGGGLKANYESKQTKSLMYVVVIVEQPTRTESIRVKTVNPKFISNLTEQKHEEFYNVFGDRYVNSITFGKKLVVTLEIDSDEVQKKLGVDQNLKVDGHVVTVEQTASFVREKLKSLKIIDNEVFSLGSKSSEVSWKFSTIDELQGEVDKHIRSEHDEIISYSTEPYSDIAELSCYTNELKQVERIADEYINKLVKDIEHWQKVMNKFLDNKNFSNCVIPNKLVDTKKLQLYSDLKKYVKRYSESLKDIQEKIAESSLRMDPNFLQDARKKINEISNWYKNDSSEFKNYRRNVLLAELNVKPKGKKMDKFKVVLPKELDDTTYLYFEIVGADQNTRYKLSRKTWLGVRENAATNPSRLPGTGVYIPRNIISDELVINDIDGNLPKDATLRIYAVAKVAKGEEGKCVTLSQKLLRDRNMTGALSSNEEVSTDYETRENSYLSYASQPPTQAALMQNSGFVAVSYQDACDDENEVDDLVIRSTHSLRVSG